jgi:hypothetical protein
MINLTLVYATGRNSAIAQFCGKPVARQTVVWLYLDQIFESEIKYASLINFSAPVFVEKKKGAFEQIPEQYQLAGSPGSE